MKITERKIQTYADVTTNLMDSTVPLWDPETAYTLPGTGTVQVRVPWESDLTTMLMPDHIYQLTADSDAGHYPGDYPSEWTDVGASNKYKAFDKYIFTPAMASGDELTSPGDMVLDVNSSKCNALHLFGLIGTSVLVETMDMNDTVIDTQTHSLIDTSRIISWYTWYTEERPMLTQLHLEIPMRLISRCRITVSNSREDQFPGLGTCFPGYAREIGITNYGIKSSTLDFSTITRNTGTGEVSWEKGDFARLMTLDAEVQASLHDYVQDLLDRLRGQPVVVSGNNEGTQFRSFNVLGLLQEPELVLKNSRKSIFNLRMEGFI